MCLSLLRNDCDRKYAEENSICGERRKANAIGKESYKNKNKNMASTYFQMDTTTMEKRKSGWFCSNTSEQMLKNKWATK
jgi:hypothetical protein